LRAKTRITTQSGSPGRPTATLFIGLAAAAALATLAAPTPGLAATTPSPATITSAFVPATIPVSGTTALAVTITNPNATATLSAITFTDTLPGGLAIDNPSGATGSCGSAGVLTAAPGSSTITLTGGKLAGGATCTVSADVTSGAPGKYTNMTGPVSSTQTVAPPYSLTSGGNGDVETVTVIANPTVTISAPLNNASFAFGQKVKARYRCAEAPGGPGLSNCTGDIANGQLIDTRTVGAQTFTVTAISSDGAVVDDTVNYTVLPDNQVTVTKVKGHKGGKLTLRVEVPGPGKLALKVTAGGVAFSRLTRRPAQAGVIRLALAPSGAGSNLLSRLSATGVTGTITGKLTVTFTPKGGRPGRLTIRGVKIPA
jgi:hypothetical protein